MPTQLNELITTTNDRVQSVSSLPLWLKDAMAQIDALANGEPASDPVPSGEGYVDPTRPASDVVVVPDDPDAPFEMPEGVRAVEVFGAGWLTVTTLAGNSRTVPVQSGWNQPLQITGIDRAQTTATGVKLYI